MFETALKDTQSSNLVKLKELEALQNITKAQLLDAIHQFNATEMDLNNCTSLAIVHIGGNKFCGWFFVS